MLLGGYVSSLGAGLSCPDWPTCYGQWLPPFPSADTGGVDPATGDPVAYTHHQVLSEWTHRLVAALLGPFLIAFAWFTWRERTLPNLARHLPFTGIGALFIQYVLGGLTVLRLSDPVLVTTHLGTATAILVMMVVTTVLLYVHRPDDDEDRGTDGAGHGVSDHGAEESHSSMRTSSASKRRADGVWEDPLQTAPAPVAGAAALDAPTLPRPAQGYPVMGPPDGAALIRDKNTPLHRVMDYLAMTKPRVMFLLVLTSLAAMFIATGGVPKVLPAVGVILGGALATGSSGAINHFLERDLDTQMARTRDRPVASGRVSPASALTFGVVLGVLAFIATWQLANLLAAFFVLCGLFFYVFVYTMWLKRLTYLNIVIGGAAGGFPALVGWAAATDSLGTGAWLLFALILVWTPPHFWALALVLRDDYAKASVPMLPVVKGVPRTTTEILVYSVVTVALSFAFFVLDILGRIFLIAASLLGGLLLILALHLHLEPTKKVARTLFGYSIIYLGLLYLVAFFDVLVV